MSKQQRLSRGLQQRILHPDLESKILSYKNVYLAHNRKIDKRGKIIKIAKESELLFRFMTNHYNIFIWPNSKTIKRTLKAVANSIYSRRGATPIQAAMKWLYWLGEGRSVHLHGLMRHAQRIVFYKRLQVKSVLDRQDGRALAEEFGTHPKSARLPITLDFQIDAVPIRNTSGNYIQNVTSKLGTDWGHPHHGRDLFRHLIDDPDKSYDLIKKYLPPKYFKCRIRWIPRFATESSGFATIIFDPLLMQYFFDKQNLHDFSQRLNGWFSYFIYLGIANYPTHGERYYILTVDAVLQATKGYKPSYFDSGDFLYQKIKLTGQEKLQTYLNQIILLQLSRMLHEILHLDHSNSPYHTIHKCNDDFLEDDYIGWRFIDLDELDGEKYMLFSNIRPSKEVLASKFEAFSVASKSIAVNILDATPTSLSHIDNSVYRFEKTYHTIRDLGTMNQTGIGMVHEIANKCEEHSLEDLSFDRLNFNKFYRAEGLEQDELNKRAKLIIDCIQKSIEEKPIVASNLISLSSIEARYEKLKKVLRSVKKLNLISDSI